MFRRYILFSFVNYKDYGKSEESFEVFYIKISLVVIVLVILFLIVYYVGSDAELVLLILFIVKYFGSFFRKDLLSSRSEVSIIGGSRRESGSSGS